MFIIVKASQPGYNSQQSTSFSAMRFTQATITTTPAKQTNKQTNKQTSQT
jgi:hypothetical protein